jgi:hypothetical protein
MREGFCRNRGNAQAVAALVEQSERHSDHAQVRKAQRKGHIGSDLDIAAAAQTIHTVFDQVSAADQRVHELVHLGICDTSEHAQEVVRRFTRRNAKSSRYDNVVRKCWQSGLVKKVPARPEIDPIFQYVAALFAAVIDQDDRAQILCQVGICHDEQGARQVVAAHAACTTPSERAIIEQCYQAGLFHLAPPTDWMRQNKPRQPYALRLPLHAVDTIVTVILRSGTARELQTQALLAIGCCRDEAAACEVVAACNRYDPASAVNHCAASLAQQILRSSAQYDLVGLLDVSDYAPAEVLFFVQRAVPYITATSDHPAATLALLQRDLVALYRAYEYVERTLWTRDLLDSPLVSTNRTHCHQRIAPEQRTRIIAALQAQHAYPQDEAETLAALLIERGGFGIIDWRCGVPFEQAGHAWEKQRLRRILDEHLGALPPQALHHIEGGVQHLKAAMQESGVTVSLIQLLNSQPYSAFRKRLNRRLPVGYGQVNYFRRKENQQRRRQHDYRTHAHGQHQATDDPPASAAALVAQFAARTGLTEREASNRLYQVRTYGGIGFIPRDQWLTLIDARLLALLKFYTFIRIEGRLHMGQALRQVNHYARQLGLTPLSAQLAKALNGALRKPKRWNSGESDRIATVRKNAGVVLPGTPWLHRVWRLFHIPLNLPIAASSFSAASETSHLLLVVDLGSQLPTGVWVSAHPPRSTDVGLALFQAIWHPGALDWPLRGAPEVLQVPASMRMDDAHTLDPAAEWLQMNVQMVQDATQATTLRKLPLLQALLDDLAFVGLDAIRRGNSGQPLTVKGMQDAVLGWIRTSDQGFAHHTPGLDDPVAVMYGLTTPAFQTPAAGFLLPVSGDAQTAKNGVLVDDRFYTSAECSFPAGQILTYRTFPYRYRGRTPDEGMPDAIYVEDQHGVLHYLVRHSHTS